MLIVNEGKYSVNLPVSIYISSALMYRGKNVFVNNNLEIGLLIKLEKTTAYEQFS